MDVTMEGLCFYGTKIFISTCFKKSRSEERPLRLSMKGKLVHITATTNEAVLPKKGIKSGKNNNSGISSQLKQMFCITASMITFKHFCIICNKNTSYQIPWSKNCLKSSTGGWAPYCSSTGIFISSTKITHFFPIGGPYIPFRLLSNLAMIMFYNLKKNMFPFIKNSLWEITYQFITFFF